MNLGLKITNVNTKYNESLIIGRDNKNIQSNSINVAKKLFRIKILQSDSSSTICYLYAWIEKIEKKVSQQLAAAKRDNEVLLTDKNMTENLTHIAIELEQFLNSHLLDIQKITEINLDKYDENIINDVHSKNQNLLNQIIEFHKNLKYENKDSTNTSTNSAEKVFEEKLIKNNLPIIYDFYFKKIELLLNNSINKIKQKFEVYNYK